MEVNTTVTINVTLKKEVKLKIILESDKLNENKMYALLNLT